MLRILFKLLVFFLVSMNIPTVSGQIYVATNGNDNNTGTVDKPFKTLGAAIQNVTKQRTRNRLKGDVKILVKKGTYLLSEPVNISQKDWDGRNTLTIEGDESNLPIFKGSMTLGNFTKNTNGIWTMDLSYTLRNKNIEFQQLYINGRRATRARTPNYGSLFKTQDVKESPINNSKNLALQTVSLTNEQADALSKVANDYKNIVVSFNHKWDRTRGFLTNVSPRKKTVSFITQPMPTWIDLKSASQFYFENSLSFLDSPGEWFLDAKGVLYYMPIYGEDINNTVAEVPVIDNLLNIQGNAGKVVKNIIFKNISLQQTKYVMPVNGEMPNQAAYLTAASINVNYAQKIKFDNCEIANISNNAFWVKTGCSDVSIIHCYIHDLGIGGIKIGNYVVPVNPADLTQNIIVDNNIIQSGGYEIPTGVGVLILHSGNNTVSHNDIADFRYSGVSSGWVWGYNPSIAKNNKIIYNHIHHLGWGELSDLGGVYTLGVSNGTEVSNNVIHDIFSYDFRGWGLYADEGSSNILMENNLVYNCRNAGFHQHYGQNNIIRNNIFANQIYSQLEATRKESHNSFTFTNNIIYFDSGKLSDRVGWDIVQFNSDYNLYWDTRTKDIRFYNYTFNQWVSKTGKDKHSIVANPYFSNPVNNNFNISNTANVRKIGFKIFDYSKAGVYGDSIWIKKTILEKKITRDYQMAVTQLQKAL